MIRLVLDDEGGLVPDLAGKAFGRGAWVHPRSDCLSKGVPRGAARSLRANVVTDAATVAAAIAAGAERRALGLLQSGWRARRLAVGSTAAREASSNGRARLLIVASDAKASAEASWVQALVREGRAMAWADKATLGAAFGRSEAGVIAVLDPTLSRELRRAIALAHLGPPGLGRVVPKHPSTEVR